MTARGAALAAAVTLAAGAAAWTLTAGAAAACPNFNMSPTFGAIQLAAGFTPDPYLRDITAGGTQNIGACGGAGWAGFVPSRPDFSLVWTGLSAQLTIAAVTSTDAVLLVNAPDGVTWYYNDDYRGVDPAIVIANPAQGRYDIWIGSYDGSTRNPGRLVITELPW
jgi:hypothetical protein